MLGRHSRKRLILPGFILAVWAALGGFALAQNAEPVVDRRGKMVLAQGSCSYSGFPVTRAADMVDAEEGPTICRSNLTL